MKVCKTCFELKPYKDFYKHKRFRDGFTNKCRSCADKETLKMKETFFKELYASMPVSFDVNLK